jgi:uncharacterized membrane protein YgdD (TMEM256/DUF423 family)
MRRSLIGSLLASGVVLFSGSIYALVLTRNSKLGMITPLGGLCMIGGWIAMAI